ncbi:hypothetical protein MPSEU_000335100 [Mayamaea pseudoterrestris]|nr:hypothetical protein MPSEU_000335100 [Mayamaea pseudoterrestris]
MSGSSIFETCLAQFPDTSSQLSELLGCVSDQNEQANLSAAQNVADGVNSFFILFGGALVFMMQAGFAMLCAGSIRAKNTRNVILWNLLDSCGGGLAYWAVGWAFAYGGDDGRPEKTFIGNTQFFANTNQGIAMELWFFQFAFACAVSSIVAGTIAERTQMKAYLMYSSFLVGFVYPVAAHSLWSTQGFLSAFAAEPLFGSGAIDLAGSGAVHMTGGVAALVGGLILGPRIGRFHDQDGNLLEEPAEITPHSIALMFLGTFLLWFGWYGFNPGSVLYVASQAGGALAGLVAVNTTLSACAGAISAMAFSSYIDLRHTGIYSYDVVATMNGSLTGLVAITSGCATVQTWAAVVIGILAGIFYVLGSKVLLKLRFDDAVDAVPVHMVGGAWGMIATGLFSSPDLLAAAYPGLGSHAGWFYEWGEGSGDFTLLGCQLIACLFIFSWSFTVMGAFFYFLSFMGWYRCDPLEEIAGMDISRHKGPAYDIQAVEQAAIESLNTSRHRLTLDSSNRSKKSTQDEEVRADEKPIVAEEAAG